MAEELETTEGLQDKLSNIETFVEEKKKPLMIGGGVVLVLVLAVIYVFAKWLPDRELKAQNDIMMAQFAFEKDSFNLALNGRPAGTGKAYKGFAQIAKDYSFTKTAKLANLYAGECCLNLKKYQDAINYLEKGNVSDPILGAVRLNAIGDAYSELGKMDEAINYYEKAADFSDNDKYTPFYLFKAGLANEKLKKNSEAKALYEKIRDNYPNSDEGMQIEKYIIRVSGS